MTQNHERMFVDGVFVAASGGAGFDNVNPATEEVVGTVPDGTAEDVDKAVAAARRAFDATSWSTDHAFRRACLQRLQDELLKAAEDTRALLVAEAGVPVALTRAVQLDFANESASHYIDMLESYPYERTLPVKTIMGGPSRRVIRREAAGVVAAVTPWNFPYYLNIAKVFPALAAGCTVVLKPAPETPFSATVIGAAAAAAGLPPGVLNVVTTADNAVAEHLVTHPGVDAVTFTGSTATGRRIMAGAAATVKRVTLELGGKSAAILLDDADFAQAVPQVAGGVCVHAGQGCALSTRLLVPRTRMDEAVEIARVTMEAIPYGDPTAPDTVMGPLISARQLERVLSYLELGRTEGRLVTGGGRAEQFPRGHFVQPTLIADVAPDARVAQEEIFGPALVVIGFDDDEDALRIAHRSIYGLSGAVFSADQERAMRLARRLRTGTVAVNGAQWFDSESPFGGYGQSGLGREWGSEGFEEFLETKTISYP